MTDVKCSCGHTNPPGTTICESCAKPLYEDQEGLINMRYEGMARRSQIKPTSILDYVWNFFSSVRNAVWMIIITLLASIIGTIFPQEKMYQSNLPPEMYYAQTYGWIGELYYKLGFHQLYSSWWYILLLLMIGVSLVICSIDRVVPLYRALHKQRIPKSLEFYRRQRFFAEHNIDGSVMDKLEQQLRKANYKIKKNEDGLLAEKGRLSRWGPYINHVGLILLILAVMLRLVPGFYLDQYVWLWEGETKPIPGTPYYVKNESFVMEFYDEDEFPEKLDLKSAVVKNYQTDAILYEMKDGKLVEVHRDKIRVNHPLVYNGLRLYQSGNLPAQLYAFNLSLFDRNSGKSIGQFEVNLYDPEDHYDLGNGFEVTITEYYPDFDFDENKKPYTKSKIPNRPFIVFNIKSPDLPKEEVSYLVLGLDLDQYTPENRYSIQFNNAVFKDQSGLSALIDRGLPVVYFSCFIVIIGLVMGFYWQHRRIWLREENGMLYLAAHTNKNWFGLRREIERIVKAANVEIPLDRMDKGGKKA